MGLDRLSLRFDAEGTLAQVNPVCIGLDQMGAPAHGLGFHQIHQIRAQDPIGETRKILNVGGGHQLATGDASSLEPGDQKGLQVRPCGVNGCCVASGT